MTKEEKLKKLIKEKDKEIKRLNKIADKYARAISLMADGVRYDELPKELQ